MVNCNETLAAYEGAIGWGEEETCGVPKNSVQQAALFGFGLVTDVSPDGFWTERTKKRGIGSQGVTQNRRTSVIGGLSVEYAAVDSLFQARLLKVFGSAGVLTTHLPTFFVEHAAKRTSATAKEVRFLYNLCKVVTTEISFSIDEPVMVTESIISQYVREAEDVGKVYPAVTDETLATIFATITIGADAPDITEDMLMYYDGEATLVDDPSGTPSDIVLDGISEMSLSIERNTEQRRGIKRGLIGRMAYEHGEKTRDFVLTLTKDFHDLVEYNRLIASEEFNFKFDVGTTRITLTGGIWEGVVPAMSEEDLIGESLTASFKSASYATIP